MASFRNKKQLQDFLEKKVLEYNQPSFIATDPVSVPHRFRKKQDIEIAGLFAAVFAWGNRTTIIQKSNELMKSMDDAPFDFILHHKPRDLKRMLTFKHRTFNPTDLLYFIQFLRSHYQQYDSLEIAFLPSSTNPENKNRFSISNPAGTKLKVNSYYLAKGKRDSNMITDTIADENSFIKNALTNFYDLFFSLEDAPQRTRKHIASPEKNSTCKRLNMYLRWMVRKDKQGVDFGIWNQISAADLICPVDLHVARVARGFGLINRKQTDWLTATELTSTLRLMDRNDPVKFDFALFSLGITEKY